MPGIQLWTARRPAAPAWGRMTYPAVTHDLSGGDLLTVATAAADQPGAQAGCRNGHRAAARRRRRGTGETQGQRRAHVHRLLRVLLQPRGYRNVEDDREALGVHVDDLGHQVRAEAVAVAACPVHHEALLLFLLGPGGQRQHAADRTAAGGVEDV